MNDPRVLQALAECKPTDGPLQTKCLIWQRGSSEGYGHMHTQGKCQLAHRLAYAAVYGAIPKGMLCLHKCDTPACCNPEHLFIGTQDDNMKDMVRKGRSARRCGDACPSRIHRDKQCRGEKHPCATLTDEIVREIRASYVPRKVSCRKLGEKYGVSLQTVYRAVMGKTWTHVV
jgi:hypothetical protein